MARRRRMAARPRKGNTVLSPLRGKGELRKRGWRSLDCGSGRGNKRSVHLRSIQSGADDRRPAVLRFRRIWRPDHAIRASVEVRPDVLIYSTPALQEDLEVTGPVRLELFAKSSAVDTDFVAKLVDVGPDGFAQNLTEGIIRARYRDSQQTPELLKPGEIYKFNIDLWATSNVFRTRTPRAP